jgi:hypothetical protein
MRLGVEGLLGFYPEWFLFCFVPCLPDGLANNSAL